MTAITIVIMLAASLPQSNIEIAENTLIESCLPLIDTLCFFGIDSVKVEIDGEHEGGWFVEQTVIDILSENGIIVLNDHEASSFDSPTINIQPMELSVEYGDISRSWLIGGKNVERIAMCELSTDFISCEGIYLTVVRTGAVYEDEVALSDVDILSGSDDLQWLSSEVQDDESGGVLEPLVVTAVVASLIYLFYSSRAE